MSDHAKCSPSGYSRWSTCSLSIEMDETLPDTASVYADKGSELHATGDKHLKAGTNPDPAGGKDAEIVQTYLDHVRQYKGHHEYEQRLHYNELCWGTTDWLNFEPRILRIGDLKTGSGVKVFAERNGQMMTYAVMARREYGPIFGPFDVIELHIIQPPLDHIDVWSCTMEELDEFELELDSAVKRIAAGERVAAPSEKACLWCRGKAVCRARAEHNLAVIKKDFDLPATLTMDEIAELLPKMGQISKWCGSIQDYALEQAEKGVSVPGYKLVSGRSTRVWKDETAAAEALALSGVPDAKLWKKKLIGLTEAEKLLGKSHPVFVEQTSKPKGAPTLVPENDPRPALESSAEDFTAVV